MKSEHATRRVKSLEKCIDCRERCSLCQVCQHMYTCECNDNAREICKHIHATHSYVLASRRTEPCKPKDANEEINMIMTELPPPNSNQQEVYEKEYNKTLSALDSIINKIREGRPQEIKTVYQQVKRVEATVNVLVTTPKRYSKENKGNTPHNNNASIRGKNKTPHNKRISPQRNALRNAPTQKRKVMEITA